MRVLVLVSFKGILKELTISQKMVVLQRHEPETSRTEMRPVPVEPQESSSFENFTNHVDVKTTDF